MSQVDDWSDGYTSDYLRDLNTYGPASANVPRPSSVVSHQVRYRAPDTSDIPLAPGQNPEGSVYSNASGTRMGQTKPASGYRAPAGGGWDVNSSDTNLRFSNESGGRRYARPKRTQSRSRGSAPANGVKTRSAPLSGADVTADVLRSIKADGNTSFANWRQSLVNQGWSQAEADAVRYDPTTGKFMSNASGQAATDHYMREQADKDAGIMADNPGVEGKVSGQTPAGQTPAKTEGGAQPAPAKTDTQTSDPVPGRSFITTENTGDNYVPDFSKALSKADSSAAPAEDDPYLAEIFAGVPPEVRANMARDIKQRKARSFVANLFADIPWWAFMGLAGSPAGTGAASIKPLINQWVDRGAGAIAGTGRAAEAAAGAAGREAAAAGGQAAGREAAAAGGQAAGREAVAAGEQAAGREAVAAGEQAAGREAAGREAVAAGEQAAGAGRAGEAAADGGVSELANAGNAGREAVAAGEQAAGREAATASEAAAGREAATSGEAAADGGVSELANAGNAGRVERVPSLDISVAPSDAIYSAIDKFVMGRPGGASAVQDAIEYVTGKAPAIEHVIETLRALPRNQLEQVFMDLRGVGLR